MNNNLLNIESPAQNEAETRKGKYGLDFQGLTNLRTVYWNLPTAALYEEAVFRGEGIVASQGPLVVTSGKNTAQALNDTFIVRVVANEEKIWWGEHNRPFSEESFEAVFNRIKGYLQGRDVFVQDCYAGTDPEHKLPVRVISENAWHSLFARNMLVRPDENENVEEFIPEFSVIHVPSFKGIPEIDSTRSETFILLSLDLKLCLIGGTGYGGEIKKSIFMVMNYLLSYKRVMTMHCSANEGSDGSTALFFGFSGTGKTALAVDSHRKLIGDDEIGWGDEGIFNLEGGCYAKAISLSPDSEPQIHACTRKFGTILENVMCDPLTRLPILDDCSITDNSRAAFPLDYIKNASFKAKGDHPRDIIMLTCDTSGVMPPIAKLTHDQAMYYFISGYTSKISQSGASCLSEPQITFSACFGAPFMVHHPSQYAEMLKDKMARYNTKCWLINTGWTGGPFGTGDRIDIDVTRTLLNAILEGSLENAECYTEPIFGFAVPKSCNGIESRLLNPKQTWADEKAFESTRINLAHLFIQNFKKFTDNTPDEICNAGPKLGK